MTKRIIPLFIALACVCSASAFDLNSLKGLIGGGNTVSDIINGVISNDKIEVKDIVGTWKYKAPAVLFDSENALKKAGGIATTSVIENKVAPYYKKVGLQNSTITFNADNTFEMTIAGKKIKGKVERSDKFFVFTIGSFGKMKGMSMKAYIKKGTTLEITFEVTKLVTLLDKIATFSGNSTATGIVGMLKGYDGIFIGMEYTK